MLLRSSASSALLGLASFADCTPSRPPPPPPPIPPHFSVPVIVASSSAPLTSPPPPISITVESPAPPNKEPVNPDLPSEAWSFLGANETHAWFSPTGEANLPKYTIVVDLATACAVESYPESKILGALRERNEGLLGAPETRADLRAIVGLALRFGLTEIKSANVVFSSNGHDIFVSDGQLRRSRDGGYSFDVLEKEYVEKLAMTKTGEHLLYERCVNHLPANGSLCPSDFELMSWSLKPPNNRDAPRSLGKHVHVVALTPDGHVLLDRSLGDKYCLDLLDPATGDVDQTTCASLPKAIEATSFAGFESLSSPNAHFYAAEWIDRAHAVSTTLVIDRQDGHVVRTLENMAVIAWDDNGTLLMKSTRERDGDHTYVESPHQKRQRLGGFEFFDWNPTTRIALVGGSAPRKSKLGSAKCGITKQITIP